jgi:hypothetical protein
LGITHLGPNCANEVDELAKVNKAVALGYTILGVAHFTVFLAILNKTSHKYTVIQEQLFKSYSDNNLLLFVKTMFFFFFFFL